MPERTSQALKKAVLFEAEAPDADDKEDEREAGQHAYLGHYVGQAVASDALDAFHPGWVDIFFGRQSIRTIHFVVALALVLFVIVHVFEVIVSGFWNNLRSMITGCYRVESEADHE